MFQNEENCDFIIYAGKNNQKIPCHKSILNSRSRFFYENHHEKSEIEELYLPQFDISIESNYLSNICENFIKENINKIIEEKQIGSINNKELTEIIQIIQSTPKENRINLIWKLAQDWKNKFKQSNKNLINKEKYIDPIQIQEINNEIQDFHLIIDNIKNEGFISNYSRTQNNPILPSTDQLQLINQKSRN
ncbi:hypothetical protein M0811_09364 [Anaeramoeba ignava]|uniref:BTB domain-containing protein n=1 Tax=Anaeramoeba ignava TaxID=1746090 RepID=A0A9Q0LGZ9_ANAIG|nr:hypothetical protein M0811_09364 [Anaeramoeba ignava]